MLRLLAILFLVLAVALAGYDGVGALQSGVWQPTALGALWFAVHPSSLQLLQPAVERHLDPVLWDPYILAALEAPAFVSALVLAAIFAGLALAFRPRRRRT
ncbi:MAG: hypothetical protein AAFW46_19350, partial [Pseudomonadota bacterium]